jgi:hypothetical protein
MLFVRWPLIRRETALLLVASILLPNVGAVGLALAIGLPPRPGAIALYCVVALLAPFLPATLVVIAFLTALTADLGFLIAKIFLLDLDLLLDSLGSLSKLKILTSPFYVGIAVGVTALGTLNTVFLLRFRVYFRKGSRVLMCVAAFGMMLIDIVINSSAAYDFGAAASIGKPFQSGVLESGFSHVLENPTKPNILLVLVESLGMPVNTKERDLLFAAFQNPALNEKYQVTRGQSTFFGSTVWAEMRELCGSRESYSAVLDGDDPLCLPDLFLARGYRTVSVHGFSKDMFKRADWYPQLGFVRSIFRESLSHTYSRRCGGPFTGPCDVDLAHSISDTMHKSQQPMFVYWLTLNSHVPVRAGQAAHRFRCGTRTNFSDFEVCSMAEIWADLFDSIAKLALANPQTEILLVGDHAPPLWRKSARVMFEPSVVPWIRLSPRRDEATESKKVPSTVR